MFCMNQSYIIGNYLSKNEVPQGQKTEQKKKVFNLPQVYRFSAIVEHHTGNQF